MNKSFLIASLSAFALGCSKPTPPPPPPHEVTATHPQVADVPFYVDYTGHLSANVSVSVRSQVSGNLVTQYFTEGQMVKKGDLLLVIDPRPYEAALAQAEGALSQALASFNYDKEKTQRYTPLVEKEFVSQLNYDEYVTNVLVDEAIIVQDRAQVETAQINLGYCYITAPMDCITGHLLVKPGNYVDANANTELMLLNQVQPILVDFYIPETDLFSIQEQQAKGALNLIVYPEPSHKRAFSGTLTLINNQIDTSTGAIFLEGTLPNEEGILWPGHFVDVRLILGENKNAILVPNQAVMIGQKGHYLFVVKEDSTVDSRVVKVGQTYDDGTVAILSGLKANELVVTEGQLNLYPGMKVTVKP